MTVNIQRGSAGFGGGGGYPADRLPGNLLGSTCFSNTTYLFLSLHDPTASDTAIYASLTSLDNRGKRYTSIVYVMLLTALHSGQTYYR